MEKQEKLKLQMKLEEMAQSRRAQIEEREAEMSLEKKKEIQAILSSQRSNSAEY